MKNKYRKLVEELGLKPLLNIEDLKKDKEVYGVGWDGYFQKGIISSDNRHVKFENEFGGNKFRNKRVSRERKVLSNNKQTYQRF